MIPLAEDSLLVDGPKSGAVLVARNLSTRYVAIAVEMFVGLLVLPFNVSHLGQSAYGLWMLAGSITAYFSVLDLGYSWALVKAVAQYRAKRDATALNEVLSTTFYLFAAFGVATYLAAALLAVFFGRIFALAPDQAHLARLVLLVISVNVAAGTVFSVFGAVINGFQRYDLNNFVGMASSIVTACVNVLVLSAGYGLLELVVATTVVRLLTYFVYRANAYRVFPGLRLRPQMFRRARLRELTGVSVYMMLIDWAYKLNYSADALIIGAFLNVSAVAMWSVGQRLAEMTQRLTNQLTDVLFPAVVDSDTLSRPERLQRIFLIGTRLSLAAVVPIGGAVMLMSGSLVHAWVGPEFAASVAVVQLLCLTVIIRVGSATASTVLKGAGHHRLLAFANSTTAVANVTLSIALVKPFGLLGVAIGTLVPVAITALLVVFPAGCRRVAISPGRAILEAVWPAVWPGLVMTMFVVLTRPWFGTSLLAVTAEMTAAVIVYAITFIAFGVTAEERGFYVSKLLELGHLRLAQPTFGEGA